MLLIPVQFIFLLLCRNSSTCRWDKKLKVLKTFCVSGAVLKRAYFIFSAWQKDVIEQFLTEVPCWVSMMEWDAGSEEPSGVPLNVHEKVLAAGTDSASQMTWTVSPTLLYQQRKWNYNSILGQTKNNKTYLNWVPCSSRILGGPLNLTLTEWVMEGNPDTEASHK